MGDQLTGWLHGNTITLETAAPPLEGKRVRVKIEPAEDSEAVLSAEEQVRLWQEWVAHGPQGPVELEDEIDLP
jgi:predicted thioesterase